MSTEKDISALIQEYAQKLDERLKKVRPEVPNEATFRHKVDCLLDEFCERAGLNSLSQSEYTLATGRADAIFNRLVIEYKQPGKLIKPPNEATTKAIEQVKRYLHDLAAQHRHELPRLAGVVFDGHYLVFVRYRQGSRELECTVKANPDTLRRFLW